MEKTDRTRFRELASGEMDFGHSISIFEMVFDLGRAVAKWFPGIPFPFLKWSRASSGENKNGISRGFSDWVRRLEGRRGQNSHQVPDLRISRSIKSRRWTEYIRRWSAMQKVNDDESLSHIVMMVRSSKVHGKKSNDKDYLEGKDWISNLPDAILCHILSFMPTRNAVRTSILSTRWKSLWASVPIIEFSNYGVSPKEDGPGSFMDFIDRVLLLHNLPILTRFLFHSRWGDENPYRLNSWISTAIKRHVQELVLSSTSRTILELPRHLFTSVDLVVLKLSCKGFCWSPLTAFLPRLKVLHLCSLEFLDDGSLKNLLSGCPVLEELEIYTSSGDKINTLCICSSTLKKLIVHNNFKERSVQCGVVIKAPSLESLELRDSVSRDFEVDELPALVKADVRVFFDSDDYEGSDYYYNAVVRMLAKASNVQHLWLYNATLEVVINASAYNELLFPSLTHLHMAIHDSPWSVVPDLLGHIPSLTVLVLNKVSSFCGDKKFHFHLFQTLNANDCCVCYQDRKCRDVCLWCGAPENVPICLSLSLEKIEFNGFSGCNKEMKLVRYLLENAMVLKKLTLRSWSRNKKIKTDLQKYKRGSGTCQIEFYHQKRIGLFGFCEFSSMERL
ncbi:hypothetical protein RHMOL_Rhmol04G0102600 [Rhododendron molle]|uniref:Uncharacterized protein n=1 Tax=Rhododendron molle TaxID=49168 RepID=A0ACC0P013_RHOML|nr:hypothetical protein RHMOL_Rhmol04G0102600 [Rhododendron molle]